MGNYLAEITQFYFDFHWKYERILGCVINDPLAVAYFIDPTPAKAFPVTDKLFLTALLWGNQ